MPNASENVGRNRVKTIVVLMYLINLKQDTTPIKHNIHPPKNEYMIQFYPTKYLGLR